MNASAISVRPYRSGDESGLVHLFEQAFGRGIHEDHWRWKLASQPTPVDNVWLAECDQRPVFQYAGIPQRFSLAQEPAIAMISVDTMTAPDFRRRGLLTQVAGRAYQAWREAGVAFVFGLPNQQWGSRAAALGWQPLFPLQWLVLPLQPQALAARRLGLPWLRGMASIATLWKRWATAGVRPDPRICTAAVNRAEDDFDRIWHECRSGWTFSTLRDRRWVEWRFLASPVRRYEICTARRADRPCGYAAYTLLPSAAGTAARLAELFTARDDHATRATLLRVLIDQLFAAGVEALHTLAVPGTEYFRWLRSAGFLRQQAFSVQLVPLATRLPLALMRDPEQWNLSGADFDVV
jgi:hypothetical protein